MSENNNPLLVTTGLPRYDEITPEHIVPGIQHILKDAEERVTALEQDLTPTWDGLLKPL